MAYLREHYGRSLKDTASSLRKHVPIEIIIVIAFTMASFLWGDKMDELLRAFGVAVSSIVLIILGVFLYNFALTPRRIYKENQKTIQSLLEKVKSLEKEIIRIKEPKLQINYVKENPDYYVKLFGNQICRISIVNLSNTESIKNVKVKFTGMVPMHPVFKLNRPVLLRFMGNDQAPLNQSIGLAPKEEVFVDVVGFETLGFSDSSFIIYTSEKNKDTVFRFGRKESFKITIQTTGDNVKTVTKKYEFGITTNKSGGDWKLWFKPVD